MSESESGRRVNLEQIVANTEYHVQLWYPLVAEQTFATAWFALAPAEAGMIVAAARRTLRGDDGAVAVPAELHAVRDRIDAAIGGAAAFVRLSSRSPKDAALGAAVALFERERGAVAARLPAGRRLPEQALQKIAHTRACSLSLRVESGEQALGLFIKSQRVASDLAQALRAHDDTGEWEMYCVVREWDDELAPELECRLFVHDNVLAGVSQYYSETFVPRLGDDVDATVLELVRAWHAYARGKLSGTTDSYAVDYALSYGPPSKVVLIEVNAPPPIAGTALFESDAEIELLGNPSDKLRAAQAAVDAAVGSPSYDAAVRELARLVPSRFRSEPLFDAMRHHGMFVSLVERSRSRGNASTSAQTKSRKMSL